MKNIKNYTLPIYEMIILIQRIFNKDRYLQYFVQNSYQCKSNIVELCNEVEKEISRYLYKDLKFFMDEEFSIIDKLLERISKSEYLSDIELFLQWLEEGSYISYLQREYEENTSRIRKEIKEDLIDLLYHEKELKVRLQFIIKTFYETFFLAAQSKLYDVLQRDFTEINFDVDKKEKWYYSYMQEIGVTSFLEFKVEGFFEQQVAKQKKVQKEMFTKLKIIAEDTRFELLKKLSIRPHYGAELANQLQLSTATISHHLNCLMDINIVFVSKNQNRQYYILNKEELEKVTDSICLQLDLYV